MAAIQDLRTMLEDFEDSADSAGYDLRLDLADLILSSLQRRGWTQKQLAQAVGMKESFITRVVHGGSNCTFGVAGKLLHALNIKAKLVDSDRISDISLSRKQGAAHGRRLSHAR